MRASERVLDLGCGGGLGGVACRRLALWPMILASERRYADSHPRAKATHPETHGIDRGAGRALKGAIRSSDWRRGSGRPNNGGAASAGLANGMS